jgi:exonuclease VII small subunit
MWKKLEDITGTQPEVAPKPTPESGDGSTESSIVNRFERWKVAAGAQKGLAEDARQPSSAPNMSTYSEALNEFTRSATAFIEQLPLLTKARDAYEQAMRASAELRKVLDTGEENLQNLMNQLEQAVSVHGVNPGLDRKKPEPANVEAIRGTDESSAAVKRYP